MLKHSFPYRNLIVVNPTEEPIKIDIPIFTEEWIEEHRNLGLEITPITEKESFLSNFRKAKIKLDKLKEEKSTETDEISINF